ncbi:MAG: ABC transporter permease [Caldilineaceae bacterium]|nr:ABC transporter permease [Caldilinea sp.]MCB0133680.1 ABC transporter permease [Caldilineaceae bacterium]
MEDIEMSEESPMNRGWGSEAAPKTGWLRRTWETIIQSQALVLLLFLIIISTIIWLISPRFLEVGNLAVVTRQTSFIALVSLGQMLCLIAGVIDLSVGTTAGFAGICAALLMHNTTMNPYLAMACGLLVGATVGLVNGLLVTRVKLNPFITTLSMSFIISGLILVVTGGWAIPNLPESIQWLGKDSVGSVPVPTIVTLIVAVILAFVLNRTFIGRHIYAIGGNKDAALIVGIQVNRLTTLVYILSGTLSALAGVLMLARLASGQPTVGDTWLLPSFAAPILGGAALNGGAGSVLGTLVGALLMTVIQNAIVMTGMTVYWENVVIGLVLVAAIVLDRVRTAKRG